MSYQYGSFLSPQFVVPSDHCSIPVSLNRVITGDIIDFTWHKPHDVLGYKLYVQTVGGSPVLVINGLLVTGQRYIVQLDPNTQYTAWIKSICSISRESSTVHFEDFTTGDHVIQCVPVNIGTVFVTPMPTQMRLDWTGTNGAIGYTVHYRSVIDSLDTMTQSTTNASITLQYLTPNTEYEYWIEAITDVGTCLSDKQTFITPVDPAICPIPKVSVIAHGTTAVIAWDTIGPSVFDVFLNGSLYISNYSGLLLTLTDLAPNQTFTVAIVSKCSQGNSIAGTAQFHTSAVNCSNVGALTHEGDGLISWAPITGAIGYKVVINGVSSIITDAFITIPGYIAGTAYTVFVYTRCATNNYSAIAAIIKVLEASGPCGAFDADLLTFDTYPDRIGISWPAVGGVTKYAYRYAVNDPIPSFGSWIETTSTDILITGLQAATIYAFEIKQYCSDGWGSGSSFLHATSAAAANPATITDVIDVTATTSKVLYTTVSGHTTGLFQIRVYNEDGDVLLFTFTSDRLYKILTGLTPETSYKVEVSELAPDYTQEWSSMYGFTTCPIIQEISGLLRGVSNEDDVTEPFIRWNDIATATKFQVYTADTMAGPWTFIAEGLDDVFVLHAAVEPIPAYYTYKSGVLINKYVKIIANYGTCGASTGQSTYVPEIVAVSIFFHKVIGNAVNLKWTSIVNAHTYLVNIVSALTGMQQYYSIFPTLIIHDLQPNTVYTATVTPIYLDPQLNPIAGTTSAAVMFLTLDAFEDSDLIPPQFTVTVQDNIPVIDNSAPSLADITAIYGDTVDRTFIFKNQDGSIIDVTSYDFDMEVKASDGSTVLSYTVGSGIIVNGSMGKITLYKEPGDLTGAPVGVYTYQLKWTTPESIVKTIMEGNYTVTES